MCLAEVVFISTSALQTDIIFIFVQIKGVHAGGCGSAVGDSTVKLCALIQKLQCVQMKMAESWLDERFIWERGLWFRGGVKELLRFRRACFVKVDDGTCRMDRFTCA